MKNYAILFMSLLLFSGCEKETTEVGAGFPGFAAIYFEFIDTAGKLVDNDKIEISQKMIMKNGKLEQYFPADERWDKMGLIEDLPEGITKSLFGYSVEKIAPSEYYPIYFESSDRYEHVKNGISPETINWYYLFRNVENQTKIDTLRIYDSIDLQTYQRQFEFFLNETLLTLHGDGKFRDDAPNYVQILVK